MASEQYTITIQYNNKQPIEFISGKDVLDKSLNRIATLYPNYKVVSVEPNLTKETIDSLFNEFFGNHND